MKTKVVLSFYEGSAGVVLIAHVAGCSTSTLFTAKGQTVSEIMESLPAPVRDAEWRSVPGRDLAFRNIAANVTLSKDWGITTNLPLEVACRELPLSAELYSEKGSWAVRVDGYSFPFRFIEKMIYSVVRREVRHA